MGGPRCLVHEFEELPKIFALWRRHAFKADADSIGGGAAGHNPGESETFDPDFSVRHPKSDFHLGARLDGAGGLHQASTCTRVGEVAPNWRGAFIDTQFDGNKALDARMPAPVAPPVGTEQIGLKRRGSGWRRRYWMQRNWLRCRTNSLL